MPAGPGDPLAGGAVQGVPSEGQVCLWADPAAGGLRQRICGAEGLSHLSAAAIVWLCLCTATNDHSKLLSGEPRAKSDSTVFAWIQSSPTTYSTLCLGV